VARTRFTATFTGLRSTGQQLDHDPRRVHQRNQQAIERATTPAAAGGSAGQRRRTGILDIHNIRTID